MNKYNIYTNKIESAFLLTLLLASTFLVLMPIIPVSAATATITTSHSTVPWDTSTGDDLVAEIEIHDADKAGDGSSGSTIAVTYVLKNSAGSELWTKTDGTFTELADTGLFYQYVSDHNSAADTVANNKTIGSTTDIGSSSVNPTTGDVLTISYLDPSAGVSVSTTLTVGNTDGTIAADRTTSGLAAVPILTITDSDLNADPTAIETKSMTVKMARFTVNGTTVAAATSSTTYKFVETGANSGVFTNQTHTVAQLAVNPSSISEALATGDELTITYTDPQLTTDTGTVTITAATTSGTATVPTSFNTSAELLVTITDDDANTDTTSKQTTGSIVHVEVLNSSNIVTDTLSVAVVETDVNTGVFTKTVSVRSVFGTKNLTDTYLDISPGERVRVTYADASKSANTSQVFSTYDSTAPTIAVAATTSPSGSIAVTLTAPDLNDDKAVREVIKLDEGSNTLLEKDDSIAAVEFDIGTVNVGKMRIRIKDAGVGSFEQAEARTSFSLIFKETGVDTGVFTLVAGIPLSGINSTTATAVVNTDVIEVRWEDQVSTASTKPTSTVSTTATAVVGTVTLDRAVYPAGSNGTVVVHITVTDSDANTDDNIVQTIVLGNDEDVQVTRINGSRLGSLYTSINLEETGPATGIFTGKVSIVQSGEQSRAWINADLSVGYSDATAGKNVTGTATFTNNDASISTDVASAKYGEVITVSVTDNDQNVDSATADTLTVTQTHTSTAGAAVTTTVTLTETGVSTGVFEKELTLGSTFTSKLGKDIKFSYTDVTPITAAASALSTDTWPAGTAITATVTTATNTGTLTIAASEFGLGYKLKITLTDNDVNADITAKDTTGSGVVKIKTGRYTTGLAVTLTETDIDTGIFEQTIQITKPGGGNTTNAKVEAAVGNTVQVIYLDAADASGSAATVIAEAKVTSVDATMAYDKANYDEGDIVTLTVTDADANLDPATIETISIGVTSTSDPIGLTLNAVETGADTGIFSLKVGTLNGIATGKLFAKTGDTITSTYSDAYPADYATAATPAAKSVTATVKVGATVTMTVPAGAISVKNSAGTVVASPTSGSILLLESTITSAATADTAYTFLVQVKNVQGEVTSLTWTTGTIAASGSLTIAQSWIPTTAGTYTVQVFVWDNLTNATPLSDAQTSTVTVGE